jgi:hypothetical protein
MPLRGTQDAENWYDVSGDDACCTTYPGYGAHVALLTAYAPFNIGEGGFVLIKRIHASVFSEQSHRELRGKHERQNSQLVRFSPVKIITQPLALLALSSHSVPLW